MHHPQVLDPAAPLRDVKDQASHEDCGKHAGENAQYQRYGETLHLVGANIEQHDAGNDRRQIRVDDRAHRPAKAIANRHSQRGAVFKLFANPLVNQHIRVDRHTDRQRQPRQAGQRESGFDENHQRQHHQQV